MISVQKPDRRRRKSDEVGCPERSAVQPGPKRPQARYTLLHLVCQRIASMAYLQGGSGEQPGEYRGGEVVRCKSALDKARSIVHDKRGKVRHVHSDFLLSDHPSDRFLPPCVPWYISIVTSDVQTDGPDLVSKSVVAYRGSCRPDVGLMPLGALYPSKSGLMNKHIVKHIVC